jgi:elongation factor G
LPGVVDLIEMKALIWRDENLGAEWDVVDIPADMQAEGRRVSRKA